jgi:uncharacterized protein (DUF302 family)
MMFTVHRSDLGFDETVSALKDSAQEHGWEIPMVHDCQETYRDAGYADMTRLTTLYFCDPEGGYRILQDDINKPMSVMMPMGVSVYETTDGQVRIAGMNLGRMSIAFGGAAKEVLREGAARYDRTLDAISAPEPSDEIRVDGRRCCLGCVSLAAIGAALAGVVVLVVVKLIPKVMPKLMAKMMPQMMAMMEQAGVQPPCAQIILERLETREAD